MDGSQFGFQRVECSLQSLKDLPETTEFNNFIDFIGLPNY
jgi:hypothetical protein